MTQWLLHLLGIHLDQAANLTDWSIIPRGTVPMPWLIVAACLLALAVFWRYRFAGAHISNRRKILMASLRTLLLIALLGLLARPILRLTVEGSVRRKLIVLVDQSQSMNLVDLRTEAADQKRESLITGNTDPISRLDLVEAALQNKDLDLLSRITRSVDIAPFGFGRNISPLGDSPDWPGRLTAPENATAIGDALRQSLSQSRGQPLAGIWLITDGQSNTGSAVATVAEQLKQANVPVYAWGVGITTPRDIAVTDVLAPDICFLHDPAPISVRVRTTGLAGRTAVLNLKLGDEIVDSAPVTFDSSGEQLVPLKFTPKSAGKFTLTARIDPLPDEVNKDNNQATHVVTVIDKRIKVLYVEQSPRWEYKYLKALLDSDKKRVDANYVLLDADPGITQGKDSSFLPQFPDRDTLLQYDLLILGDVDPKTFSPDDLKNISDFVSQFGGSLLTIAGHRFMPAAYAATPIDDLLPIDIPRDQAASPIGEQDDIPIHLELAPGAGSETFLQLGADPNQSAAVWEQLPPIFWDAPVARLRDGAKALVVDPDPLKANRDGKMPVIAMHAYGVGQVMYVGTDNLWRWRRNMGEENYTAFWGQIVQAMALPHLLGDKRTQLSVDKSRYVTGESVTVFARLYDETFQPIDRPQVTGTAIVSGQSIPFSLRPIPAAKGSYTATFPVSAAGDWRISVETDPSRHVDFTVVEPNLEQSATAMNQADLESLAETTNGRFFREENLKDLPDLLTTKTEQIRSTFEAEVCFTWLYFGVVLFLLTAEWTLRKLSQLK